MSKLRAISISICFSAMFFILAAAMVNIVLQARGMFEYLVVSFIVIGVISAAVAVFALFLDGFE